MVLVGVLFVVVGVVVSIGLHEWGHYRAALRAGAKVSEFMIGFGPQLVTFKRGETTFGIKAIPLGGYVRILGMLPPGRGGGALAAVQRERSAAELDESEAHRAFWRISPLRRAGVLLAGPAMNLALALVAIVVAISAFGVPQTTNRIDTIVACTAPDNDLVCAPGSDPSAAASAGVRPGDAIVAVNGVSVSDWDTLTAQTAKLRPGSPATLTLERDGQTSVVDVVPTPHPLDAERAYLGLVPEIEMVSQPVTESARVAGAQFTGTVSAVALFPVRTVQLAADTIAGKPRDVDGPVSLVGVGQISAQAAAADVPWRYRAAQLVGLFAALNMSLFVFNLVPLPPLDGGHIVPALADAVRNRLARRRNRPTPAPLDTARLIPVSYAVALVLIAMTVLITGADLANPL